MLDSGCCNPGWQLLVNLLEQQTLHLRNKTELGGGAERKPEGSRKNRVRALIMREPCVRTREQRLPEGFPFLYSNSVLPTAQTSFFEASPGTDHRFPLPGQPSLPQSRVSSQPGGTREVCSPTGEPRHRKSSFHPEPTGIAAPLPEGSQQTAK